MPDLYFEQRVLLKIIKTIYNIQLQYFTGTIQLAKTHEMAGSGTTLVPSDAFAVTCP